ncbi:hypothetical protein BC937DRAFT_91007 [Endogone sp. FLAS-F59071]|nr:hypothetical protein BC937DRAFT_91007 [Endogone sp. FLAS-F59071]|eukprot:RUS16604.1 hypothetical protein BC937DRAFT_91007 [Endogone sp. FLAS-F59071]
MGIVQVHILSTADTDSTFVMVSLYISIVGQNGTLDFVPADVPLQFDLGSEIVVISGHFSAEL